MTASFWENERCERCNGLIKERVFDVPKKIKGKNMIIENIPAGVCMNCGTRYYAANVLEAIEETFRGRRKAKREVRVPVYSF